MSKKPRTPTIHKKEMVLNKDNLKEILDKQGLEYIVFHDNLVKEYGLDLSYKGFMSLLQNRSTWKLLYAHAMTEMLNVDYKNLFEMVDVNFEEEMKKREKWKEYKKKGVEKG